MALNKNLLIIAMLAFPHLSLATIKHIDMNNTSCESDYHSAVSSLKEHCIRLVSPDLSKKQADELIIYLHGDYGIGGSSYMSGIAAHFSKPNRMNIALIRPGYFDDNGNFSSGSSLGVTSTKITGRLDSYTRENVDIIADAISNLKKNYKSKRVVVIGHSGGAALAALILNFYPQLIDKVLLINCPCDVKQWRPDWEHSLSPIENINLISPKAKIDILSGAADDVVFPELCKRYAHELNKINNKTEFFLGIGMKHNLSDETTRGMVLQHIQKFLDKD
ncbi:alpha/beta hydrolase [Candidatus Berkiella cookevillensis]|uniref:Alpha/beta hydrolase n=1 Tax=Candidatus Berkiella cookevillensis TaxID=437022 RepID=A0A0Q9YFT3_9GAMM|nr:alpha/beta hydrolase [Candidatus Berkiella cookevillensis]MCS5707932.1 alpha/beta hydrolase [Candidatus Berkiella cookevillensis]